MKAPSARDGCGRAGIRHVRPGLVNLKSDLIARNFDADTLPNDREGSHAAVMEILRSDFSRFLRHRHRDGGAFVQADEATEKEANAQIMQVIGTMRPLAVFMIRPLPPPMIINMTSK
jgi:hypothetical protein